MTAAATLHAALLAGTALGAVSLPAAHAQPAPPPNAMPVLDRVVTGGITVRQDAAATQVTQTQQRGIVNWQRFDVGRDHQVRFQQPSAQAVTLNRVTGRDPSVIAGRITANGRVAVVNQSGVVFSAGSQVEAAGIIASTADIADAAFLASGGRLAFDRPSPNPEARVENHGTITVREAGLAALVAPRVVNRGVIAARLGRVGLAGAEAATVDLHGDGLLSIEVTRPVLRPTAAGSALVTNTGAIGAPGGTVLLTAAAADGLVQDLVRAGGRIAADTDAATGRTGRVVVAGTGGAVRIEGEVRAVGTAPGTAGGAVDVVADRVWVADGARVNASGAAGGGAVGLGTTRPGDLRPRRAGRVGTAPAAVVRADATNRGRGGSVYVHSLESTSHAGSISVRGGPSGGDGGFAEVSGDRGLRVTGVIDAQGPAGRSGAIVLDPENLEIVAPGDRRANTEPGSEPASGNAIITSTAVANFTGNLTLAANNDIVVEDTVIKTSGDLALDAGRDIRIRRNPSTEGTAASGPLTLSAANGLLTLRAGRDLEIAGNLEGRPPPGESILFVRPPAQSPERPAPLAPSRPSIQIQAGRSIHIQQSATVSATSSTSVSTGLGEFPDTTIYSYDAEARINIFAASGSLLLGGTIRTGVDGSLPPSGSGLVSLSAGLGGVVQGDSGRIVARSLDVVSNGDVRLDRSPNTVNVLTGATAKGDFAFDNGASSLGIGNVTAHNIAFRTAGTLDARESATLTAGSGNGRVTLRVRDVNFDDAGGIDGGVVEIAPFASVPVTLPGSAGAGEFFQLTASVLSRVRATDTLRIGATTFDGLTTTTANGIRIAGPLNLRLPGGRSTSTLDLRSLGEIAQASGASLNVSTLSGAAAGAVTLTSSGNDVGAFGSFRAGERFEFATRSDLALEGPVSVPGGTVKLDVGGTLSQLSGAPVTASLLTGRASGGFTLSAAPNAVDALGGISAGGDISLGTAGGLVLAGPLDTPGRTVSLSARGGAISAGSVGRVAAGLLELDAGGGPVSLPNPNAVARLGRVQAAGDVTLAAAGDLQLDSAVTATSDGLGGTLRLDVAGRLTQTARGVISAGTLAGRAGGGATLLEAENRLSSLGGFEAPGGAFELRTAQPTLAVAARSTLSASNGVLIENPAGAVVVDGTVIGADVILRAPGGVLQVNGRSAIARTGDLLLAARDVTVNGLVQAGRNILVRADGTASLAGEAVAPAGALRVESPRIAFGDLDAGSTRVVLELGTSGTANGALNVRELTVAGGDSVRLVGSVAGIGDRRAAALGRRATPEGDPIDGLPPRASDFTFNGCAIGVAICLPFGDGTVTIADNPGPIVRVLDLAGAVQGIRRPAPDVTFRNARDRSEEDDLDPPGIRGEDF